MKTFKEYLDEVKKPTGDLKKACWDGYTAVGMKMKNGKKVPNCVPEEVEHVNEVSDKTLVNYLTKVHADSQKHKSDPTKRSPEKANKSVMGFSRAFNKLEARPQKEEVEQVDETAAWQRKEGKRESGGLNQKGVDSYRREHPGSKLKTAVTTKPSKLKPGSKAANRRKSFCARMSGMKKRLTSAATAKDPDSRINKSLRKWNC
jgi:hypothetical protein